MSIAGQKRKRPSSSTVKPAAPASSSASDASSEISSVLSSSDSDSDSDSDAGETQADFHAENTSNKPMKDRLSAFLPQLARSNAELDCLRRYGEKVDAGFEISAEAQDDEDRDEEQAVAGALEDGDGVARLLRGSRAEKQRRKMVREVDPAAEAEAQADVGAQESAGVGADAESEEEEGGPYIEMNLGLGVLEEQSDSSSSDEDTSEEGDERGHAKRIRTDGSAILKELRRAGHKGTRGFAPKARERPKILEV